MQSHELNGLHDARIDPRWRSGNLNGQADRVTVQADDLFDGLAGGNQADAAQIAQCPGHGARLGWRRRTALHMDWSHPRAALTPPDLSIAPHRAHIQQRPIVLHEELHVGR